MKTYAPELIRNVAIVGHGGSGKTMLVEHMLYTAGATERVGSVESGNTQSDFDQLEVKHHHSIGMSVLPLEWHDHKVNLIDVPGFSDFAGELAAAARVADAMIIVCEAKSDLDVGFDLAWEAAEREGIPRCIFVNKLERDNADYQGLIETLHTRYGRSIVLQQIPIGQQAAFCGVLDLVTMKVYKGRDRGVEVEDVPSSLQIEAAQRREKMMDAAAEGDDDLAMKYLEGQELTPEEIEHGMLEGTKNAKVVPVLLGSAATGIGVATLLDRIVGELPSPIYHPFRTEKGNLPEDPNGPLAAFVFKTSSDPYVGRVSYVRVFSGTLKQDMLVKNMSRGGEEKLHHLSLPHGKSQEGIAEVKAGDICVVAKLNNTGTSDTLSTEKDSIELLPVEFPEPVYRVAVRPASKTDEDRFAASIQKLLDEDPTLRYTRDASVHQEVLEGLGDMHIETVIEKLKVRYGVNLNTEDARVPYKETIRTSAKAQGKFKRQSGGKGQYGDCWLELHPLDRGAGFSFENKVVGGAIPKNYIPAVEKGVHETMTHGFLAGFPVVDVRAVVYDGSYHDVDSSEQAFKTAATLAFKNAAALAQPILLEPILDVWVDVADGDVGDVVGDLNTRRGQLQGMEPSASGRTKVNARVPMATMARYALDLRSITKGRGRFGTSVSHYSEVPAHEAEPLVKAYALGRTAED